MEAGNIPPTRISLLKAIANCKCPVCRTGKLYTGKTWNLREFDKMNTECPHCGQDFVIEPGFYLAATYISYAFLVVLVILFVGSYFAWFDYLSEWWLIGLLSVVAIVLLPVNFRYSRTLLLHFFSGVRYDPERRQVPTGWYIGQDGDLHEGQPPKPQEKR